MNDWMDKHDPIATCDCRECAIVERERLRAEVEALRADAGRLAWLAEKLDWDGNGYWLPDLCIKERAWGEEYCSPPTTDEVRFAIDVALAAKEGGR